MSAVAIEINDASLVVASADALLAVEPGFAIVERDRIVTGEAARARARLQPRQASSRFWSALSLEPRSAGADIGRSAAELAFAQLDSLWQRVGTGVDDVVIAVPGAYGTEQLGLLLGLVQECGIPVRALVDTAAAASVRAYPGRQLMYVDASLYRVSATVIDQADDAGVRSEHALAHVGLNHLLDAFARRIADAFVRATRFDPFQHAEVEQQLYDRMPEWLATLQTQDRIDLALSYRGEEFVVAGERETILHAAANFYRAVKQLIAQHREPGSGLVLLLSARLASLPGLMSELSRLDDAHIERLPLEHVARGALAAPHTADADGRVRLVKRLAWREAPALIERPSAGTTPVVAADRSAAPTHVVYRGVAYPVGPTGLVIGREADGTRRTIALDGDGVSRAHCELVFRDGELWLKDLSRYGTFVNEKRIPGETTLQRADVIRVGSPGVELEVVSVEAEP